MEDENMSRYKDWPKNPRMRDQMAPKHELPSCGLWPNGLRVTIMHTLFDLFAKGCGQIQTLIICTYFLESSGIYK